MIRVVLDTNIIVSALLQPLGPPAQAFVFAGGGSIQEVGRVAPNIAAPMRRGQRQHHFARMG